MIEIVAAMLYIASGHTLDKIGDMPRSMRPISIPELCNAMDELWWAGAHEYLSIS